MEDVESVDTNLIENKKSLFPLLDENYNGSNMDSFDTKLNLSFANYSKEFKNLFNIYKSLEISNNSFINFLEFLKNTKIISSNLTFEYRERNNQNNTLVINKSRELTELYPLGFDLLRYFNKKESSDITIIVQGIPFYSHRVNFI